MFDQDLEFDGGFRRLGVVRLRSERVRFPVELLHQEVEAPADWLVELQDVANLDQVTVETIELFVDIQEVRKAEKKDDDVIDADFEVKD